MPCFKQHKESLLCENKKPQPTLQPGGEPDPNPQSMIYVDPEDDEESTVPREALERLGELLEWEGEFAYGFCSDMGEG